MKIIITAPINNTGIGIMNKEIVLAMSKIPSVDLSYVPVGNIEGLDNKEQAETIQNLLLWNKEYDKSAISLVINQPAKPIEPVSAKPVEPVEPVSAKPIEPVEPVSAKPVKPITVDNVEADNLQSPQEIIADTAKLNYSLAKEDLEVQKEQLVELKEIRKALTTGVPGKPGEGSKDKTVKEEKKEESGSILGSILDMVGGGGAKKLGKSILGGAKALGKQALSLGSNIAKFAGSGAGKLLGATAAVGLGAYTAYKGYSAAEDSKQAKIEDIQAKLESGEIDEKQASELRKEVGNTATVEKSGAIGEGTGLAGGAIAGGMAGAKLGATIGTFVGGPVGTAIGGGIGTIAGGALGAFAGTKAGKYVGEKVGEGINYVSEKTSLLGKGISDWLSNKKVEIKDTYNRGTGGTLAFQNKEEEVARRAKEAGIIDKDGNITDYDKYNKISKQITEEIKAADPSANRFASQEVSAKQTLDQSQVAMGDTLTSTSEFRRGTAAEKSVLGSTTLGALFSAKGLETGGFYGSSEISKSVETPDSMMSRDENTTVKNGQILGRRISSGSLFKSDTYKVSGTSGEELDVSKSDYFKLQKLAKEGNTEEADKLLAKIKLDKEINAEIAAGIKSPEESLTPVTPEARGLSLVKDSTENINLLREASKPTVSSQPIISNSVNTVNTTSYVPVKGTPRSEYSGSALDRYNNRIAVY